MTHPIPREAYDLEGDVFPPPGRADVSGPPLNGALRQARRPTSPCDLADEVAQIREFLINPARGIVGRQIADALAPVETFLLALVPCTECGGTGETYSAGHYVPGEQFVEPPTGPDMCGSCRGTGRRGGRVAS